MGQKEKKEKGERETFERKGESKRIHFRKLMSNCLKVRLVLVGVHGLDYGQTLQEMHSRLEGSGAARTALNFTATAKHECTGS